MRLSWIPTLALVALSAFACSRSEEAAAPAAAAEGEPAAAAAAVEPEVSAAPPAPYTGYDYTCADGVTFNAKLEKGNALVTIDGKTSTLMPAAGGSGAQYEGEGLSFTARGEEATLARDGETPKSCKTKS